MKNPVKRARLKAICTQAEAAKAVKVSQSTYHRWESGSIPPPPEKLAKLAKLFGTTVSALKGAAIPFDMLGLENLSEDRTYYGEVAVHFQGPGAPLLLSITGAEFKRAITSIQTDSAFLNLASLDNRTVFIRRDAIADLYFSSDACETNGADGVAYEEPVGVYPDVDFWEQVGQLGDPFFDPADLPDAAKNLRALLQPTEADLETLLREGRVKEEHRATWLTAAEEVSNRIFGLARIMYWQMGSVRREAVLDEHSDVYGPLVMRDGASFDEAMGTPISVAVEQQTRVIQINPKALDYLSVPTHMYESQHLNALEELDG